MGKDVNNTVPPDPDNPHPAVGLPPTPGKAPLIGQAPVEVLRSDPKSGAYIAFTGQVPPTKYFEVIGRADCDDWLYLQLMNADMIINRPRYYAGGEYTGDKAALKCAGVFHRKFRDKSDDRLVGADGVIFDHESAVFTDVDGWFNQNRKLHMDGWAIKFVEPSVETIRARLATPVTSAIDVVQMRAAAFWIEKHHASDLAADLRRILPLKDTHQALTDWKRADHLLLRALASVEDDAEPDDVFRTILDAGIAKMLRPGAQTTVSSAILGEVPFVAANVIVCRKQPGAKEELRKVLLQATIRQHKLASAKGLIALGDSDFVKEQLNQGRLGDVSAKVMTMLSGIDVEPFACPYRSKVSA
ncbi:hypothetical protein [Sulfuricystis multivorans]|uniref:hypothetical protein n=1 Tax=Sulfuricystis multivorans TaxID=2211108 RepID=UPI000F83EF19|nr:hypothetical protein [Sulfuricystis multivorans]